MKAIYKQRKEAQKCYVIFPTFKQKVKTFQTMPCYSFEISIETNHEICFTPGKKTAEDIAAGTKSSTRSSLPYQYQKVVPKTIVLFIN